MIHPSQFYDLLTRLTGQFFSSKPAICVKNDFGVNFSSNAREYFTVAIIPTELPNELAVLGVLLDDSAHIPSRNGFTFTIYIDLKGFIGNPHKVLTSMILAHEICHFAFYYELFINLGDSTDIRTHSNFTHAVSTKLIGAVTNEPDNTSQTIIDEHDILNLLSNFRKFPKSHFSKGQKTNIDYQKFLLDFLMHLDLDTLLRRHKRDRH